MRGTQREQSDFYHDKPENLYDLIVVGSGAGAVTAAVTAASKGLKTIILEKGRYWGGSSAMSGGGIWIPDNHAAQAAGMEDSFEEALTYMETIIGDVGPASSRERKVAYLKNGPRMLRFLEEEGIEFLAGMEYPDYYPDKPGGKRGGRSVNTVFFDTRRLGDLAATMRVGTKTPIPVDPGDAHHLPKAFTGARHFFRVSGMFAKGIMYRVTGRRMVGLGSALMGHLMYTARRYRVPLWLNSPCRRLIVEGDRVTGVEVERNGETRVLRGRAVLLAAGGFAHNAEMRQRYQGVGADWTVANPDNTGDVIQQCMEIGADMALLDDAWWGACSVEPDGNPYFILWERSMPHSMVVDQDGRRYTNESASYVDFGHDMLERHESTGGRAIPSWLILDARHRNRYIFGLAMPRLTPKKYMETGYFIKADSLEELARRCRIPGDNLTATVARFNSMAEQGVDEDFGRGRTAYHQFYGDSRNKNPNLGTIEKAPFFAVKIYPGDLGTKGGMVTDEYARVLKGGKPIPGLYATGNCTASVMGRTYPGAGATLGPSMTFGFIAAEHAAADIAGTEQAP